MAMQKYTTGRVAHEIHVKAQLSELYNFDEFTQLQRRVINEAGCTACTSGVNLRFHVEQFFGKFHPAEVEHLEAIDAANEPVDVRVVAPADVANDFKANVAARQAVLRELGCPNCTSGYNIQFDHEIAYAVNAEAQVVPLT